MSLGLGVQAVSFHVLLIFKRNTSYWKGKTNRATLKQISALWTAATILALWSASCTNWRFSFYEFCRTPLQNRQLDGAMHRVPPGFYDKGGFFVLLHERRSLKILKTDSRESVLHFFEVKLQRFVVTLLVDFCHDHTVPPLWPFASELRSRPCAAAAKNYRIICRSLNGRRRFVIRE